jgi:hypothetical protein
MAKPLITRPLQPKELQELNRQRLLVRTGELASRTVLGYEQTSYSVTPA